MYILILILCHKSTYIHTYILKVILQMFQFIYSFLGKVGSYNFDLCGLHWFGPSKELYWYYFIYIPLINFRVYWWLDKTLKHFYTRSFNANISRQLLDYKIAFVNSHHKSKRLFCGEKPVWNSSFKDFSYTKKKQTHIWLGAYN